MNRPLLPASAILVALTLTSVPRSAATASARGVTDPIVPAVEMFFSDLHDPLGMSLPGSVLVDLWDEINRLGPVARGGEEGPWQLLGPRAMHVEGEILPNEYQGRVLDLEVRDTFTDLRAAAASGGLWWMNTNISPVPQPIADDLESLVIGSFATDPTSPGHVVVGTGEPGPLKEPNAGEYNYVPYRAGVGMFLTTDFGQSWTDPLGGLPPRPECFYRVRWDPGDPVKVFALSELGIYRSTDAGQSWEWPIPQTGIFTDIAFHPWDPDTMWAARWDQTNAANDHLGGLYRSTDGGATWDQLTSAPIDDVGRTSISVVSNDPSTVRIYLSVGRHSAPDDFIGIFRSTDAGASFTQVASPDVLADRQAWYNNAIAASPDHPEIVLVGWTHLFRPTDSGDTWTEATAPGGLHPDHHLIQWTDDGYVYTASDGGIYTSWDNGTSWMTDNRYPITQLFHLDVNPYDHTAVAGCSTDNGVCTSLDPLADGGVWYHRQGGDSFGVAYHNNAVAQIIWWTNGPKNSGHTYRNYVTLDGGTLIGEVMDGIDLSTQWLRPVSLPRGVAAAPVTGADGFVYRWNGATQWDKLNQNEFASSVRDLCAVDDEVLWATTKSSTEGVDRVLYRDGNGNWFERSTGLPDGASVRRVSGDRYGTEPQRGYAIMNGMSSAVDGKRLYKTTDAGMSWVNVTGNLPDIPCFDLVENPVDDSYLYLATELGAFRSADGGSHWLPWNDGWPRATIATEFVPVFDGLNAWIYAATWGRSAWRRNLSRTISADAPLPRDPELNGIAAYPNPFRTSTSFRVLLDGPGTSRIVVVDVGGRVVRQESFPDGTHGWNVLTWDGRDDRGRTVAPGTYFVSVRTPLGDFRSKVTRLE